MLSRTATLTVPRLWQAKAGFTLSLSFLEQDTPRQSILPPRPAEAIRNSSECAREMSKTGIVRIASSVIAAYVVNAILVFATNQMLSPMAADAKRHFQFLVIDVVSQCLYTIVAGYLCTAIAGQLRRFAIASLIALGLTVGTFSLVTSWNREPHWYGISLLLVYAPCVWVGCWLRSLRKPLTL